VKPQVAGLDLAGYSTAELIRSEGSITRLKSQTKRKQNSPPLCCCVADATANRASNFWDDAAGPLKRSSTSVGPAREPLETIRRAGRRAATVDDCALVPPSCEVQTKTGVVVGQKPTYFRWTARHPTEEGLLRRVEGAKI
jgi:hypothetical protein